MFIDLKLHDIGNTVAQGVKSVARLGATFLTVHAYPQTMKAAADAREGGLRILAVTVLTSYDDADLAAAGYGTTVAELVARRAAQARELGVDGLVCSAEEAAKLRAIVGPKLALVTPGIRPVGSDAGEQKRIATPAAAIAAGADYLVVGRPIIAAADPKAAADGDRCGDRGAAKSLKEDASWRRAIGFRRSMSAIRKATRPIWRRRRRRTRNITAWRWCAAAEARWSRVMCRSRCVIREFPDYAAALACYRSDEYQRARPLRLATRHAISSSSKATTARNRRRSVRRPRRRRGRAIGSASSMSPIRRLQALCRGQCGAVRPIRRAFSGPRRPHEVPEGKARSRIVVIEFPSFDAAVACYRSPNYQAAKKLRDGGSTGDLVIVEGYDGAGSPVAFRRRPTFCGQGPQVAGPAWRAIPAPKGMKADVCGSSDMRVVIAGAGGRMGRTLIHAVAATKGLVLAGAVEAAGSPVVGRDAGELAGLGPNGIKVTSDVAAAAARRRRPDRIRACRRRRWLSPN